jgi:putative FmdB family regulatory protein
MPTYQYRCSDCGQDLEVVQKFTDSALTTCPSCEGQLRKVYNAVGVVFKGSGFYSTDSRSSKSSSSSSSNGSSEKTNGSSEKTSGSEKKSSDSSTGASKSDSGSSTPAKATAAS